MSHIAMMAMVSHWAVHGAMSVTVVARSCNLTVMGWQHPAMQQGPVDHGRRSTVARCVDGDALLLQYCWNCSSVQAAVAEIGCPVSH
jgi:hypothetical protein